MTVLNFPPTAGEPTDGSFTYEENGVLYSWDGVKWTANRSNLVSSLNGGPLAGFRNQIINGSFDVRQRGNNFTQTSGTNGFFADRWVADGSATGGTWQASLDTTNFPAGFAQSYTVTADVIRQFIELPAAGKRGAFSEGSTWTVSIWANSANIDRCQFIFADSSGSRNNDVFIGNANFVSTGETSNGFTRYSGSLTLPATAPAASNMALMLNFVFTTKTATKVVGAQLEPGPIATPFEHRPIGAELSLCQRYYQVFTDRIFGTLVNSSNETSATNGVCIWAGPYVKMRAVAAVEPPPGGFGVCTISGGCTAVSMSLGADMHSIGVTSSTAFDPRTITQLRMLSPSETWALNSEL